MVNLEWRKPIELFIDQQVFIDAVRGHEEVSEFSAVTEVTTFEQRGEHLHLEGNILFTAFMEYPSQTEMDAEFPNATAVEQVQHRMPFDISVPVDHQVAGPLNVSMEVSDATIDVLGPGWLHIRALINVEGLSGDGGYVAHCGAQEAVVGPLAEPGDSMTEPGDSMAEPGDSMAHMEQGTAQTGRDGVPSSTVPPFTVHADAEASPAPQAQPEPVEQGESVAMGEARREAGEEAMGEAKREAGEEADNSLSEAGWKTQLADADRALGGGFNPFRTGRPAPQEELTALSAGEARDVDSVAEFHFEALRSEQGDIIGNKEDRESVRQMDAADGPQGVLFTERTDSGVKRAGHMMEDAPITADASDAQPSSQSSVGPAAAPTAVSEASLQTSYSAVPEVAVNMTAAEWFWKTLNVPKSEVRFTMKFRIVQAEESLEDIAQAYRVTTTELLRANRLTQESVDPGSLLYIPVR